MIKLNDNQQIIFDKLKDNPDKWFMRRELDELVPIYNCSGVLIKFHKLGFIDKKIKIEQTGRSYALFKFKK